MLLALGPVWGQEAGVGAEVVLAEDDPRTLLPAIQRFHPSDALYLQLQRDIESAQEALARGGQGLPGLRIFRYAVESEQSLIALASGLGLRLESLATLNRFATSVDVPVDTILLIPNQDGLFLALDPVTEIERLLSLRLSEASGLPVAGLLPWLDRFVPAVRFTRTERDAFLRSIFRNPVPGSRFTSGFGMRRSPLSGQLVFHGGVDLATSVGQPVYAARAGSVREIGNHPVYGTFVILDHDSGYQTLYGHLNTVLTSVGAQVRATDAIGTVGATGAVTGAHLHFEVRLNGVARDPVLFLSLERFGVDSGGN